MPKVLGIPAIADDSGLVVEALDGEPECFLQDMPVKMPPMKKIA